MNKLVPMIFLVPVMLSVPSYAKTDSPVNTVKSLYADAFRQIKSTGEYNDAQTLFKYADKDLRYAISLVQNDSVVDKNGLLTSCHTAGWGLHLINGNGLGLEEATNIEFASLRHGEARALIDFGEINQIKDFSVQCGKNSCQITDVFDDYGESALKGIMKACQ